MSCGYTDVLALIPPAMVGVARLVHDSPSEIERLRAAFARQPLDREKYARLFVRDQLVMTDARFERITNAEVVREAHGDALIGGLGIGLVLQPIIAKCTSVTVVEKEPDVIALVGPHFPGAEIVLGDVFTWAPPTGRKYDTIYFDIWPAICADDLKQATALHRRFRKYLRTNGYMQSWTRIANRCLGRGR